MTAGGTREAIDPVRFVGNRSSGKMGPALANVADKYVHEPWTMPPLLQAELGCVVGRDYPAPIVDHGFARQRAIAVFGEALARRRQRR